MIFPTFFVLLPGFVSLPGNTLPAEKERVPFSLGTLILFYLYADYFFKNSSMKFATSGLSICLPTIIPFWSTKMF